MRLLIVALVLLGPLLAGGCAPAPVRASGSGTNGEVRSALRALTDQAADPEERVAYAADRLARYGLVPAAGGAFVRAIPSAPDSTVGHIVGYVPGRDATRRSDLVVVAGDLYGSAGAAVLTVAYQLAQQGAYRQVPGPTVLVGLWALPRTGALGFEDYATLPGWAKDRVSRIVVASADTTDAGAIREALRSFEHAAVHIVTPPRDTRTGGSTLQEMQQAREVVAILRWTDALLAGMGEPPFRDTIQGTSPTE